jgi:hypothetical protein
MRPCSTTPDGSEGMQVEVGITVRMQSKSDQVVSVDIDETLRAYERDELSLGRLAELLGIDREQATALVESRGLSLRIGPRTVDEAWEELRVIERLESR